MQLILFDDHSWENLLPLTFTRPVAGLRVGILTIAEKWEKRLEMTPSHLTQKHLSEKFRLLTGSENLLVNGSLLPGKEIAEALMGLRKGSSLKKGDALLGVCTDESGAEGFNLQKCLDSASEYPGEVSLVDFPWKIFQLNGQEIEADMTVITQEGRARS